MSEPVNVPVTVVGGGGSAGDAEPELDKAELLRRYGVEQRAALAELEAAKARNERESARELARFKKDLLADLLSVVDDLDRALAAAHDASGAALRDGVELVRRSFLARLAKHGVARVESLGHRFDPRRHQAVATSRVMHPDRDGIVLSVLRAGYQIGDEVLRPADVVVGRLAPSAFAA